MANIEHRPCPFCGSETFEIEKLISTTFFFCGECFAQGPAFFERSRDREGQAWSLWDARGVKEKIRILEKQIEILKQV